MSSQSAAMEKPPAITDPNHSSYARGYHWLMQHVGHDGEDCLIWPFNCCTPGYGIFKVNRKWHRAHRYMCEVTSGAPPEGALAAHSCGNRRCVNPKHLSWKTGTENQLDRRRHGTGNPTQCKLTREQANQIRNLKGYETRPQTAAKYGITESNVRLIQEGITWKETRKLPPLLSREQVLGIREAVKTKTQAEVAKMFGTNKTTVGCIVAGKAYRTIR